MTAYINRNVLLQTYDCSECSKSFTSKHLLLRHQVESHDVPAPHQCNVCQKGFIKKDHLHLHQLTHLKNDLELSRVEGSIPASVSSTCRFCEEKFRSREACFKHEMEHALIGENRCTLCDKNFLTKATLRRHITTHQETVCTLFGLNNSTCDGFHCYIRDIDSMSILQYNDTQWFGW